MASFTDELIECQSKLRSLALLYKELKNRHDPAIDGEERIHKLILSCNENSIFFKDPDIQTEFQEKLIERLSDPPKLPKIQLFADSLLQEFLDPCTPVTVRSLRLSLAEHFERRFKYLAQYKFKIVLKWARLHESEKDFDMHEEIERIGNMYSDAFERNQRLVEDEYFNENLKRPVPKTVDGTNLYLHAADLQYSNISRDDLKHYITHSVEHSQKTRKFKNFLKQVKNLSLCKKWELWEGSIIKQLETRAKSTERMKILTGNNLEFTKHYLNSFKKPLKQEEVPGQDREIEMPPLYISDIIQLQGIVSKISKEFNLKGEMELDDGHSLAYQVTHLYPELFELQKLKQEWAEYGDSQAKQVTVKRLENLRFMKSYRVTYIRKSSSYSETNIPILKPVQVAFIKKTDWLHLMKLEIKQPGWMQKQQVRLNKLENFSNDLESVFKQVDIQDIGQANRSVEDAVFNFHISQKNQENGVQKEEEIQNIKKYFSILLAENITKTQTSQLKIPLQIIKTYYVLILLKDREMKNKIIDLLNAFRSIQRRIVFDLNDLDARENFFENKLMDIKELQGRWDSIVEYESYIYVKDETGECIVYDCVLEDYNQICKQLILLGNFYMKKHLENTEQLRNNIDMNILVSELLELEHEYQQAKYKLITCLVHFYDNSIDKTIQEKLAYRILKLITLRPKLNLKSPYFFESYKSQIAYYESQALTLNSIIKASLPDNSFISPIHFDIDELFQLISSTSKSLSTSLTIESPKQQNFLDTSIWDLSLRLWKFTDRTNPKISSAGILLDKPEFIENVIRCILDDHQKGRLPFPTLTEGEKIVIDEISLYCNYYKLWKLQEALQDYIEEGQILHEFYLSQTILANKEVQTLDKIDWGSKFHQEVDEGPGINSMMNLACKEIDHSLTAFINCSDFQCIKYLLLPWGIEEFSCVLQYQIMHTQCLSLSAQMNQAYSNDFQRTLSELKLFTSHSFVPNHYSIDWKEYLQPSGLNKEKLEKFRQRTLFSIQKYFCNCFNIKTRNRVQTLEKYKIFVYLHGKGKKDKALAMFARRARVKVISEYIFSVLQDIYPLAIKVQILAVLESYKKLVSVMPLATYKDIYKGVNFYESDRNLFDFTAFPTVKYFIDYPCKTIEDLPVVVNANHGVKSVLFFKYNWNLSYELLKILQGIVCLVQSLHIKLFINFLSLPGDEILQLWENIEYGEAFFSSEKSNVLEQTSETLIEDQITEAFSLVKFLNENQSGIEKDERIKFFNLFVKQNFDILTISVLSTFHYVCMNNKLESAKELTYLKKRIFKYKSTEFPNGKFQVNEVSEQINKNSLVHCGWIPQLDWAFSSLSASERSRGFTVAIAVQLKTENFLRSFTALNKMHEIKSILDYLKTDILLLRLKSNFFHSQIGEYEVIQEVYRSLIEEKADALISDVTTRKDFAKVNAEIKVLKEFFSLEICKQGVSVLENCLKQINSSIESDEPFSIIAPPSPSPEFLKKINVLTGFLNILKNRGTIVQASGGKAAVYTIKDLSSIISRFADQTSRYKESEKREHLSKLSKQITLLESKLKDKRKKLQGYQKLKLKLENEISDMVTARITQKGAKFMYEIDITQRQLKEIKENSHVLQLKVREKITSEYNKKYEAKVQELQSIQENFSNFQSSFSTNLQKFIDQIKNEGLNTMKKVKFPEKEEDKTKLDGNGKKSTLVVMQNTLRKLRVKFQWKRLDEMQRFQKYINELKEQLTSNKYLNDQLNESKSREDLLKKELHFTQISLMTSEKLETRLKKQIHDMKVQEEMLQSFKDNNLGKIEKMKQRVDKFRSFKEIDDDKMRKERGRQEKVMKSLAYAELQSEEQYRNFHNSYTREILKLKEMIAKEKQILWNCEKLILVTQGEIEGVEHYEESEWKRRYFDLLTERKEKKYFKINTSKTPQKILSNRSMETYSKTPQKSYKSFY